MTIGQAPGQTPADTFDAALDALVVADRQMRRMFGTATEGALRPAA